MRDAHAPASDWAGTRRRRWSSPRIAAALLLHALALMSLKLAIDRVQMPRPGLERATTLVTVALHPAPPPTPAPPPKRAPATTRPGAAPAAPAARPVPAPQRPHDDAKQAGATPAPDEPVPIVAAAPPPASAPRPDLSFLDNAAARQAIRNVARGDTLASHGNALTHEESGSELLAADGSHCNCKRDLPPPPPAQLLAQNIAAAHKGDCMKGDFLGGGMGLLSAPFLLAAEAMGKCAHKL
jgi:hypothetical protein